MRTMAVGINVEVWAGRDNRWWLVDQRHNLVTDRGLELIAEMFEMPSSHTNAGLLYCEVGSGRQAPAPDDTALGSVVTRVGVNRPLRDDATLSYHGFFPASNIPNDLYEAGLWGGPDATTTTGTGALFARTSIEFLNADTPRNDLRITWALTFDRVHA